MSSGTPPFGCGPPKPVNVRFNDIKVKGPDSDVVYHRVTVRDVHFQLATNTSVSLLGDSLFECAKATAGAGLDAFVFNGSCTGYPLNLHFLKCQTGDLVIYVRADSLDEEPVGVHIDDAPFTLVDDGSSKPYRMYMVSGLVQADDDHPIFTKVFQYDGGMVANSFDNYIRVHRENGDIIASLAWFPDYNSCYSNGAYGLPAAVYPLFYDIKWPFVYFFEECGNTVRVPKLDARPKIFMTSHPGIGCRYYPSGLPDKCSVTLELEGPTPLSAVFGFFFPETNSDSGGLNLTVTGSNFETGDTETTNMFLANSFSFIQNKMKFEVSLQRQPSKRAKDFIWRSIETFAVAGDNSWKPALHSSPVTVSWRW